MEEENRSRLIVDRGLAFNEVVKRLGTAFQAAPVLRSDDGGPNSGNGDFGPYSPRAFVDQPTVYAGYWSREGMKIDGRRYALETPVMAFPWRSPTVLPDGKIVAQFGRAVLLIDPERRTAKKLAEGFAGDVLLDPPPSSRR